MTSLDEQIRYNRFKVIKREVLCGKDQYKLFPYSQQEIFLLTSQFVSFHYRNVE